MSHLVKLNVIVGSLVLILAFVLGAVIAEFTASAGRTDFRKPRDAKSPRWKPGVQAPSRPGLPAVAGAQDHVEWMLL
jgi:hypothetical protein